MAAGKYAKWLEPDGRKLLEAWARDGLTYEQIARNCGVTESTLYEWIKRYPEISESLKKGREIVDVEVENALLKRALGYEYTERMTETSPDGVKTRTTRKEMPPDVTAAIFWLKNRRPDAWRDKAQADHRDAIERLDRLIEGISHEAKSETKGILE